MKTIGMLRRDGSRIAVDCILQYTIIQRKSNPRDDEE
jgi:hypothetical protein